MDDDAPLAVDVLGADWAGVGDLTGADETLTTDPVALIELLAVVERVVEFLLLDFGDAVDQVVSRLIGHIGVFLHD